MSIVCFAFWCFFYSPNLFVKKDNNKQTRNCPDNFIYSSTDVYPYQAAYREFICTHLSLHGKTYFLFPDVLKRWSFQKIVLEYDLSCIIGKDNISFSRKYDLIS